MILCVTRAPTSPPGRRRRSARRPRPPRCTCRQRRPSSPCLTPCSSASCPRSTHILMHAQSPLMVQHTETMSYLLCKTVSARTASRGGSAFRHCLGTCRVLAALQRRSQGHSPQSRIAHLWRSCSCSLLLRGGSACVAFPPPDRAPRSSSVPLPRRSSRLLVLSLPAAAHIAARPASIPQYLTLSSSLQRNNVVESGVSQSGAKSVQAYSCVLGTEFRREVVCKRPPGSSYTQR